MPKKLKRDMKVQNIEIRKAVSQGVSPDSPLIQRHFNPVVIKELEDIRKKRVQKIPPTKLEQALLDRYNETHKTAVENTIDDVIDENILLIREIIQNMIDYGDARVFKVIPSELSKMIHTYGVVAQQRISSLLGGIKDSHVYVVPSAYHQCNLCGRFKAPRYFPSTNSDISRGKASICTDCANELLRKYLKKYKDIREVLLLLCHKLDIYAYQPTIEKFVKYYETSSGKEDIVNGLFVTKFTGELLLQKYLNPDLKEYNFEHSRLEGVPFKCVKTFSIVPAIYNDKFAVEVPVEGEKDSIDKEIEDENIPLSQYSIKKLEYKFGKYDPTDLKWLEKRYREFEEVYNVTELSTKKLVNQLCCQELFIVKQREQGIDVIKQYKSYIETMKALNLTPKQQAKSSSANGFDSLSEFIQEAEKHGPIIERSKEFNDVDGIHRFMIAIAGFLSKTMGKHNEYVEAFDQIYGQYSSSLLDMNMGDEDEE